MINVDTDMIIPKQFLKTIKRTGLGKGLFFEIRYDAADKKIQEFVLNKEPYNNSSILLSWKKILAADHQENMLLGRLLDFGIKCLIGPSFADIFYNNCFKNGMLPIILNEKKIEESYSIFEKKREVLK